MLELTALLAVIALSSWREYVHWKREESLFDRLMARDLREYQQARLESPVSVPSNRSSLSDEALWHRERVKFMKDEGDISDA